MRREREREREVCEGRERGERESMRGGGEEGRALGFKFIPYFSSSSNRGAGGGGGG